MYNKFKVKKKIISIALAIALAAQPLATFPMNVFAGNALGGKKKVDSGFEVDNIVELEANKQFDVNDYVKNIKPQGATVSYTVESQNAFSGGENVLDEDGKVINSGIAKVKVTVNGVSKKTYIVADIEGILGASSAASDATSRTSELAGLMAVSHVHSFKSLCFYVTAYAGRDKDSGAVSKCAEAAEKVASDLRSAAEEASGDVKVAWNAAKNACESAKTAWNKGRNLEAELQIACVAYCMAEAIWTQLGNNQANLNACKAKVNALQEVIGACYKG